MMVSRMRVTGRMAVRVLAEILCFFRVGDRIRDDLVTGVQTCALPIYPQGAPHHHGIRRSVLWIAVCPGRATVTSRVVCLRSEERRVGRGGRACWRRYR